MTQLRLTDDLGKAWALVTRKAVWVRINRMLAWVLVLSPALQWWVGTPLQKGLLVDLVILLAHGGLSLWLFGRPKTPQGMSTARWVFAWNPLLSSARARFLMSGWTVMMCVAHLALVVITAYLFAWPMVVLTLWFVPLWFVWWNLRLPVSTTAHLFGAGVYASRRWGTSDHGSQDRWALLLVLFFWVTALGNLFRV